MRKPVLGMIECEPAFGCMRCGRLIEKNILSQLLHDLSCWGWGTALFNARCRLFPPEWF